MNFHTKYLVSSAPEVILQSSSYSQSSKYIRKTGISNVDKMPISEFLELIETSIIMIHADLRHYEKLEEII